MVKRPRKVHSLIHSFIRHTFTEGFLHIPASEEQQWTSDRVLFFQSLHSYGREGREEINKQVNT